MFDEKKAIERWRAQLAATGALFEADLDELESHLADHLEALEEVGITGEEAFLTATERLGETRSLAAEFAKVNPLLAWRAALFWITGGLLLTLAGRPLLELGIHATVAGSLALHVGPTAITIVTWAVAFASPLAFFALLFPFARRHVDAPLPWARSPVFRVGVVVGSALLMLVGHLLGDWGWLDMLIRRWAEGPLLYTAWRASTYATYSLAVVALLVLLGVAVRQRALAMKDRAGAAPLFWLAVGLFIGTVRWELHIFVRSAAFACGGFVKLQAAQMHALMWIVSLACPLVLFASTYAYLRHRAPGPSSVLRAPMVLVTMAASSALAIGAVFATNPVAEAGPRTAELMIAGYNAWLMAGIVTSCALPVMVGVLMLRLRRAGSHAVA